MVFYESFLYEEASGWSWVLDRDINLWSRLFESAKGWKPQRAGSNVTKEENLIFQGEIRERISSLNSEISSEKNSSENFFEKIHGI